MLMKLPSSTFCENTLSRIKLKFASFYYFLLLLSSEMCSASTKPPFLEDILLRVAHKKTIF